MTKKDRPWGHRTDLLEIGDFHEGISGGRRLMALPSYKLILTRTLQLSRTIANPRNGPGGRWVCSPDWGQWRVLGRSTASDPNRSGAHQS